MATLSSYTTKLQAEVDTTSNSDVAVLQRALQATYQDVLRETYQYLVSRTSQDVTLTVGTSEYTPSSEYQSIEAVYYRATSSDDWTRLEPITNKDWYDQHINNDNGTPSRYYVRNTQIILDPPPDTAGTIRIYYIPVPATLTGDVTSIIPDRFEDVVIMGAAKRYYDYEYDAPHADQYERNYLNQLYLMKMELSNANRYERIRPTFWGGRGNNNSQRYVSKGFTY